MRLKGRIKRRLAVHYKKVELMFTLEYPGIIVLRPVNAGKDKERSVHLGLLYDHIITEDKKRENKP